MQEMERLCQFASEETETYTHDEKQSPLPTQVCCFQIQISSLSAGSFFRHGRWSLVVMAPGLDGRGSRVWGSCWPLPAPSPPPHHWLGISPQTHSWQWPGGTRIAWHCLTPHALLFLFTFSFTTFISLESLFFLTPGILRLLLFFSFKKKMYSLD